MKPIKHQTITNAGAFNRRIRIVDVEITKDADGFPVENRREVLTTWAAVRTTRGMTIIVNDSDFEKAYTNFTIRYPKVDIKRDMRIEFRNREYTIEYLNNINGEYTELEIQAKEVSHDG